MARKNLHPAIEFDVARLPRLSRRMRQTLEHLLAGDSEKQIAHRLSLSRHTVHAYVKALYREFGVNSRGELLARFVSREPSSAASIGAPDAGSEVRLARVVVCL